MSDQRRMDAYYYGFDETGCDPVDKVLSAVACAGKAYHHTENWSEEASPWDDHSGETPLEWIQKAAQEAADRIEELEDKLEKAVEALEKVQAFVRDLEPHADQGHTLVPALREACEILAELKGED
jgi:uncharacterized protein Yka (UPF0111/DUF47 family)